MEDPTLKKKIYIASKTSWKNNNEKHDAHESGGLARLPSIQSYNIMIAFGRSILVRFSLRANGGEGKVYVSVCVQGGSSPQPFSFLSQ